MQPELALLFASLQTLHQKKTRRRERMCVHRLPVLHMTERTEIWAWLPVPTELIISPMEPLAQFSRNRSPVHSPSNQNKLALVSTDTSFPLKRLHTRAAVLLHNGVVRDFPPKIQRIITSMVVPHHLCTGVWWIALYFKKILLNFINLRHFRELSKFKEYNYLQKHIYYDGFGR